jgi:sodium pump decarboxylase gamma subunit
VTGTGAQSLVVAGGEARDLADALVLSVVGIGVVFVALVVLALVIGRLVRLLADRGGAEVPSADGAAAPVGDGALDRRHLVVIAAAVAAAVGPRSRMHRIVMLGNRSGDPWVTEGRVVVMGSHRPHR